MGPFAQVPNEAATVEVVITAPLVAAEVVTTPPLTATEVVTTPLLTATKAVTTPPLTATEAVTTPPFATPCSADSVASRSHKRKSDDREGMAVLCLCELGVYRSD